MTGHTNAPQVVADCFTKIQVIGTSQFVFVILDIIRTTSSAETSFLSTESLIRKPRKGDQGQKVPLEVRDTKNIAETLGKEGYRTQKPQKVAYPGTKLGSQVDMRSYWRQKTPKEEAGAEIVPYAVTRATRVDLT